MLNDIPFVPCLLMNISPHPYSTTQLQPALRGRVTDDRRDRRAEGAQVHPTTAPPAPVSPSPSPPSPYPPAQHRKAPQHRTPRAGKYPHMPQPVLFSPQTPGTLNLSVAMSKLRFSVCFCSGEEPEYPAEELNAHRCVRKHSPLFF